MTEPDYPDLSVCDSLDLASYLLKHRFENDAMATTLFLLKCAETLPGAEAMSAQLLGNTNENVEEEAKKEDQEPETQVLEFDIGDALSEPLGASFTNPRGKLQLTFHKNGIHCKNVKDDQLIIASDSVERIIIFPKPEDCRTASDKVGDMVLLCLSKKEQNAVSFKNKVLPQVCLQLPNIQPKLLSKEDDETDWIELLVNSLHLDPQHDVARVYNPILPLVKRGNGYTFESFDEGGTSTTTGGMPYVKCYKGVQDGALFPMEEGLLFFKPPMFYPRSELHSIACGRGAGGSRYVDMALTLDSTGGDDSDTKQLEFSNIHRDELRNLNDYIHKVLIPAMTKEVDSDDGEPENDEASAVPSAASPSLAGASPAQGKRYGKRKASRAAREATRAELAPTEDTDSEGKEDDDEENWISAEEESSSDEDLSLSESHNEPIDDSDDDENEGNEEEGDTKRHIDPYEIEGASSTESDEEKPVAKKGRKR